MGIIVASSYDYNGNKDILWASHADTEVEEKAILWDEIERLIRELDSDGLHIRASQDSFGELIFEVVLDNGSRYEYKQMNNEGGRTPFT